MSNVAELPPPHDASRELDGAASLDRGAVVALGLSTLLPALATSITNVALPTLGTALGASFHGLQWVVLAYLVVVTAAVVAVGRVGDLYGRGRTLQAGIAVFTLASAAGALAHDLPALVAARAAQGLGAAAMLALGLALVAERVPASQLGRALGVLGTTSAVGTALGPTLGGLLLGSVGWRAVFWIHVPLGLIALLLSFRHLGVARPLARPSVGSFDVLGTVLLAGTLALAALAATMGAGSGLRVSGVLAMVAVAGAVSFGVVESRAAAPLVQPALVRDPVLRSGLLTSALVATVVMTTMVVGPFHLSGALGLDPRSVGLVMSVGPVVAALTGAPSGRVVDRFGSRAATLAGLAGMAVGTGALAVTPEASGIVGYVLPIAALTSGYSLFQTANNSTVMRRASDAQRGVVSGMLSLSRSLGLIMGASMMGAVFASATGVLSPLAQDTRRCGNRADSGEGQS